MMYVIAKILLSRLSVVFRFIKSSSNSHGWVCRIKHLRCLCNCIECVYRSTHATSNSCGRTRSLTYTGEDRSSSQNEMILVTCRPGYFIIIQFWTGSSSMLTWIAFQGRNRFRLFRTPTGATNFTSGGWTGTKKASGFTSTISCWTT